MKRLFTNILSNWALLGVSMIVGFFMLPILLGRLGKEAYGVIVLASTLAGYTNLLRAGLGGAVVQSVAQAKGREDAPAAGAAASGVLSLYLLLGILALAVGSVLAWQLPNWFDVSPELAGVSRRFGLLTALLVALQFPGSVFTGILQGLERYDRANLVMGLGLIARTAAILAWVHQPEDLVRLGWIHLVVSVGEILMAASFVRLSWSELRLGWRSPRDPVTQGAGRFGLKNLVLSSAERLIYDTDSVVVGASLSAASVATYNVGGSLARYARLLLSEVTRALGPTMSRLDAGGERQAQRDTFLLMTRLGLLLALPLVGIGWAVADELVELWVGPGYEESVTVLRLLLLPLLFTAPQSVAVSLLWGMGRLKVPVIVYSIEAVANLGLSLWWVRLWGLTGVALGTLVPVTLLNALWLPKAGLSALDLGWGQFWSRSVRRPALLVGPLALLAYGLSRLELASWGALIAAMGSTLAIYLVLAVSIGLSRSERQTIRGRLRAARGSAG